MAHAIDHCDGTVAIVGGGAAGLLSATHLLRNAHGPMDIVLIEADEPLRGGVAYSTDNLHHLLNAPAGEMSAHSDRPMDLVDWARARGMNAQCADFLPRAIYREYLVDTFTAARRGAGALRSVSWIHDEAVAVRAQPRPRHRTRTARSIEATDRAGYVVGLASGGHIDAGHVVLAIGAPKARAPWRSDGGLTGRTGLHGSIDACAQALVAGHPGLIDDPWAAGALDAIPPGACVLLVGTGLTMVDVALSLGDEAHGRRLIARSRRGLLPLAHQVPAAPRWEGRIEPRATARQLMRAVRRTTEDIAYTGGDWRSVVASVRQQVPELWGALSESEQARFRRLAHRHWEVHRHRMAPDVATQLTALRASGRLDIGPGRLFDIEVHDSNLRVRIATSTQATPQALEVSAIVNCTGVPGDYARDSSLVRSMVRSGLAQPDRIGLGLEVDQRGHLVSSDGAAQLGLHTIGWARRGATLETTAIPEIRRQAEQIACEITLDIERRRSVGSAATDARLETVGSTG